MESTLATNKHGHAFLKANKLLEELTIAVDIQNVSCQVSDKILEKTA
jgi:hypothetical protein